MIVHIAKFLAAAALFVSVSPSGTFAVANSIRASSSSEPNHGDGIHAAAAATAADTASAKPERKLADEVRSLGFDTDMADFMRSALVTKMSTQRMVDETLVINGEVLTFDSKRLQPVRVTTDGSNANIYEMLPGGRGKYDDGSSTIRVLKKPDGKIEYVSIHVTATGERIGVAAFGKGKNDLYAIYSSNDLDKEAVKRLKLESIRGPNDKANPNANSNPNKRDKNGNNGKVRGNGRKSGGGRTLQTGTCSSYKVIRLNARFDAGFCASYNGVEQDAIDRINFIVSEFNDSYMAYPLCTKVETCGVTGSCDAATDDYNAMISGATGVCGGTGTLISTFRQSLYPQSSSSHLDLYPDGECDTTALFFGNDLNGNDWFPSSSTVGCAYIGSICDPGAASVNKLGQFSNVAAQAVLMAHELGHNLDARHDSGDGFIMAPSFCSNCGSIAETFSSTSVSSMSSFIASKDTSSCVGSEAVGPTPAPISPPTPAPIPPTRSPTPAPVRPTPSPTPAPVGGNNHVCNTYSSFGSCYYGGCVWNGSCYSEEQITCEELTNFYYCLYNGAGCAWDMTNGRCITYFY